MRLSTLFLSLGVVTLAVSWSASASAEEPEKRPVEIPLKIKARRPVPMVIDIARAEPKLGVKDLKPSLVDRIERAAGKEPF